MQQELEDHHQNLAGKPAVEEIREIAKHARFCLFGTALTSPPVTVRPMTVQSVDDAGALWFLSGRSTHTNQHIAKDPLVQLFFANPEKQEFLTLDGTATIHTDRATREAHWTPFAKTWFNLGVDDPDLTVLRFQPAAGYYWDNKHGKTVAFLKSTAGMLVGKTLDDSLEGKIRP
jgi:general stress protein 26